MQEGSEQREQGKGVYAVQSVAEEAETALAENDGDEGQEEYEQAQDHRAGGGVSW